MPHCEVEKGVRLYYESFGSGEPVVFVHGGGMSHEGWEQQVYELADHFHVITYDLRGHGESDKPPHGHSIDRFVLDLEALVKHLRLDKVSLVCHAIGGYIGISYALRNPASTEKLVLVNSGVRAVGDDEERGGFSTDLMENYFLALAENKVAATVKYLEPLFFFKDPGIATRQQIMNIMMQWPIYAMKLIKRDLQNFNIEGRLHEIVTPTLVIHGRHDRKQRFSGARYLAGKIPNARLEIFENSAHFPPFEEVGRFNRLVMDFLKEGLAGESRKVAG